MGTNTARRKTKKKLNKRNLNERQFSYKYRHFEGKWRTQKKITLWNRFLLFVFRLIEMVNFICNVKRFFFVFTFLFVQDWDIKEKATQKTIFLSNTYFSLEGEILQTFRIRCCYKFETNIKLLWWWGYNHKKCIDFRCIISTTTINKKKL